MWVILVFHFSQPRKMVVARLFSRQSLSLLTHRQTASFKFNLSVENFIQPPSSDLKDWPWSRKGFPCPPPPPPPTSFPPWGRRAFSLAGEDLPHLWNHYLLAPPKLYNHRCVFNRSSSYSSIQFQLLWVVIFIFSAFSMFHWKHIYIFVSYSPCILRAFLKRKGANADVCQYFQTGRQVPLF